MGVTVLVRLAVKLRKNLWLVIPFTLVSDQLCNLNVLSDRSMTLIRLLKHVRSFVKHDLNSIYGLR